MQIPDIRIAIAVHGGAQCELCGSTTWQLSYSWIDSDTRDDDFV